MIQVDYPAEGSVEEPFKMSNQVPTVTHNQISAVTTNGGNLSHVLYVYMGMVGIPRTVSYKPIRNSLICVEGLFKFLAVARLSVIYLLI